MRRAVATARGRAALFSRLCALWIAAIACSSGTAFADEPAVPAAPTTPAAPARAQRIRVAIAADAPERDALSRVLLELMQRLAVEVEFEAVETVSLRDVLAPVPADTPYLARCFVDLRVPGQARLYVHDPVRDRVLERTAPRGQDDGELAREELGHMLLASIEALQAGATLGSPRSEIAQQSQPQPTAPEPVPEPVPDSSADPSDSEPATTPILLRGAVLYEAAAIGFGPGVAHGPLLAVLFRAPWRSPELGVLLSAQYRVPWHVEADPISVDMQSVALRALLTFEPALGASTTLRFGLGAGADLTHIAAETTQSARIVLSGARTLTLAVGRALVGLDVRLSQAFALWAALAADVDLDRMEFVYVAQGGRTVALTEPWRVRPALSLGMVLP